MINIDTLSLYKQKPTKTPLPINTERLCRLDVFRASVFSFSALSMQSVYKLKQYDCRSVRQYHHIDHIAARIFEYGVENYANKMFVVPFSFIWPPIHRYLGTIYFVEMPSKFTFQTHRRRSGSNNLYLVPFKHLYFHSIWCATMVRILLLCLGYVVLGRGYAMEKHEQ